jgi:hypothetical protein
MNPEHPNPENLNPAHGDRILEAGLDEVVGGHYPPDLSAKILQAWEERLAAGSVMAELPAPPSASRPLPVSAALLPLAEPVAPPLHPVQPAVASPRRRRFQRSTSAWLGTSVAAGLLAILVAVGIHVARHGSHPAGGRVVAEPERAAEPPGAQVAQPSAPTPAMEAQSDDLPPPAVVARQTPQIARRSDADSRTRPSTAGPPAEIAAPTVAPKSDGEMIAFVDQMLQQSWREQGITPAAPADDPAWCRRVYQRLIGREPTGNELRQFLDAPARDRRQQLVAVLLASEDYAAHWARIWAGVLQGPARSDPASDDPAEGLQQYLVAAFRDDKPYDQVAAELISATGAYHPDADDYDGATGFLAAFSGDHELATDRVARSFLGKQMSCARCHDHPSGGWNQSDFWELNAFFRQMKLRQGPGESWARLVDEDFYGETGVAKDAEIFYHAEDGRLRIAYPRFAGAAVSHSGLVADVNRRRELGGLISTSPDFRTAAVNRIWAELLGYGLVEPVDDAGPHNPPSHPRLLEGLADQLAARDFQLKSVVRWVVLSETFGLSDQQTPESWMDTPETGGRPLFARHYTLPKQDSADLYGSLMLAVRSRPPRVDGPAGTFARQVGAQGAAHRPQIIDTQGSEALAGPQWLDRLAANSMPAEQKVEHLFLSVLGRKPSAKEAMAARLLLADRLNDHLAVRELWQTLWTDRKSAADRRQRIPARDS